MGEIKTKVKDLEEQWPMKTFTVTSRAEEVCKICGVRLEALNANNQQRYDAHFTGAVHRTYAKIREWIEKLKENQSEADRLKADKADRGRRDDDKKKDKERDDKKKDRERDGDRDRDRDRKDRDRDRRRSQSRSRRSR